MRLFGDARFVGLALALACACGHPPLEERLAPADLSGEKDMSAGARGSPARVAAEPTLARLEARLAARAVYHEDYARGRLYTWTTAAQIEALRASKTLLVATAATDGRPSPFNRALARLAAESDGPSRVIARALIEDARLAKRRYAWTSPFATTMGLGTRRYGDALIELELDPRAVILRFMPYETDQLAAVDLRGEPVALAELAAAPGRIGAVYHAREGPRAHVSFREFVACNPAMIASWSIATPALEALIEEERALLEALRVGPFAQLPEPAQRAPAAPQWRAPGSTMTLLDRWRASLAFDNDRYRPSAGNLEAIERALAGYDGRGPALVVDPRAR